MLYSLRCKLTQTQHYISSISVIILCVWLKVSFIILSIYCHHKKSLLRCLFLLFLPSPVNGFLLLFCAKMNQKIYNNNKNKTSNIFYLFLAPFLVLLSIKRTFDFVFFFMFTQQTNPRMMAKDERVSELSE